MDEEILKQLEEIKKRVSMATPGPWKCQEGQLVLSVGNDTKIICQCHPWPITDEVWEQAKADMIFIAYARQDTPRLCQIVQECFAQCAAMREALEEIVRIEPDEKPDGTVSGYLVHDAYEMCEIANAALKYERGRDLLARLHKLERVAEAAQEYLAARELYLTTGKLPDGFEEGDDPTWKLREALSVLEEENDGDL